MDHLRSKHVKTKKPHQCHGCAEIYPAGSKMEYVVHADQREILTSYWCETCETVIAGWESWQYDSGDGIGLGELKECDESWKDIHEEINS